MTTTQLIFVASVAGAMLFFAAGAALIALRQRGVAVPLGVPRADDSDPARAGELARLRQELEHAQATVRRQAAAIDEQNRLFEQEATNDRATAVRDLEELRERAMRADTAAREVKRLRDETAKLRGDCERYRIDTERLRADGEKHRAESEKHRAESEKHRAESEKHRAESERHRAESERLRAGDRQRGDSDRLRADVERLTKEATAAAATTRELRNVAEDRAKQLERARSETTAAATELAQVQTKLRDIERQLADKIAAARDLSTENEQLKGRLRDAEALRAEYVRLRTATTDSEFLKSEIARLEQELREVRVTALGPRGLPQRQRPARGTDRQQTTTERTISESLARVIERFADAGTRSSAVGDPQGFPLASAGSDGVALAAYAALLNETALRAKEYLPVGVPTAIEVVDTSGVRVSVWSLEVDSERLLLANLAVSPVDAQRVETALGDLTHILAPSEARAGSARR